jgi:hypothetical protein
MVAAGGFHRKGSEKRDSGDVAGQEAAMPFCDGRARYTGRFRFANIFFTSVDRADGRQAIVQRKKGSSWISVGVDQVSTGSATSKNGLLAVDGATVHRFPIRPKSGSLAR